MHDVIHTESVGPLTINVYLDPDPMNPFENWDCEPPIYVYSDRSTDDKDDLGDFFRTVTPTWVSRHWRAIFDILDMPCSPEDFTAECKRDAVDYGMMLGEARQETFIEVLAGEYESRKPATLAALYKLAGVPCYHGTSTGYSQGHWAEVLVVCTPAWAKEVGAPARTLERQAKGAFDLWSAWAWGDVYMYIIEDENGDILDSCWGFYGDENRDGYMMDEARAEARAILDQRAADAQRTVEAARAAGVEHVLLTI